MRLAEATMEMTDLAMSDGRESEADKKLLVVFSRRAWHNKVKSATEGRPIYDERDFITIMVPGDKDSIIERPIRDTDIQRFSRQYEAYQRKTSQTEASGTPLRLAPFLNESQCKELEYFNCYTIENLADLADGRSAGLMGIQALKARAQAYLKAAAETAPIMAMKAEMEQKDNQLAAANTAIAELVERVKALEKKKE